MKKIVPMKLFISVFLLTLFSACATTPGVQEASFEKGPGTITDIRIEDNRIELTSDEPFTYTVYSSGDPYKTFVEIPDMNLGTFTGKLSSDSMNISEIIPSQTESPRTARFDIILKRPATIVPFYEGNKLSLLMKTEEDVIAAEEPVVSAEAEEPAEMEEPALPAQEESVLSSLDPATEVVDVAVKRADDTVKIIIEGNGKMEPNVFPLDERIVVDIPDVSLRASIPEGAVFPLESIRAGNHRDRLRLVLDLEKETSYDVSALGSSVVISLLSGKERSVAMESEPDIEPARPRDNAMLSEEKTERLVEGQYVGKKISLDFQDADLASIFRLLADIGGYNIVVDPKQVTGSVTLKLVNVPWDQALDLVLRTHKLEKVVSGNIIRILPASELKNEYESIKQANKARAEAGELKTRIFPVNYADLSKLKDAIDKAKVLSSRGSITLDERGSSIIVNDIEENLEKTARLLEAIDRQDMQARQVMIEAKIVELTTDYTKDLGISWGATYSVPRASDSLTIGGLSQVGTAPSGNNFLVNLPAAVGAGSGGALGFGYINKAANFALDVQLSALESNNHAKILSNPKILTMNNQEATITQGSTIYIPIATADKTDLKAIDALLSLKVKPRIAPGGAIFMDLDIAKDEPGAATAGGVNILKNTVKTSVLVNNGDTVVIGGIFKKSNTEVVAAVPGLSEIPVLGSLFKKNQDVSSDTEVLVFITPNVVEYSDLK
jgi:type IV pilus assembly protein PilQ